jgi:hypothetical protein
MTDVFKGPSDERQSNDVHHKVSRFRPTYRALTDVEKQLHDDIKAHAEFLEYLINKTPGGRYQSLALTELELTVMWAIKGLTQ